MVSSSLILLNLCFAVPQTAVVVSGANKAKAQMVARKLLQELGYGLIDKKLSQKALQKSGLPNPGRPTNASPSTDRLDKALRKVARSVSAKRLLFLHIYLANPREHRVWLRWYDTESDRLIRTLNLRVSRRKKQRKRYTSTWFLARALNEFSSTIDKADQNLSMDVAAKPDDHQVVADTAPTSTGSAVEAPQQEQTSLEQSIGLIDQPKEKKRNVLARLSAGLGHGSRFIKFYNVETPNLQDHSLPSSMHLRVSAGIYPFARTKIPFVHRLGWAIHYQAGLIAQTTIGRADIDRSINNPWHQWRFEMHAADLLGADEQSSKLKFDLRLGVGQHLLGFALSLRDPLVAELPTAAYTFLRPAAELSKTIGHWYVGGSAGFRGIVGGGPIQDNYLSGSQFFGGDLSFFFGRHLYKKMFAELRVDGEIYGINHQPQNNAVYRTTGAVDAYLFVMASFKAELDAP